MARRKNSAEMLDILRRMNQDKSRSSRQTQKRTAGKSPPASGGSMPPPKSSIALRVVDDPSGGGLPPLFGDGPNSGGGLLKERPEPQESPSGEPGRLRRTLFSVLESAGGLMRGARIPEEEERRASEALPESRFTRSPVSGMPEAVCGIPAMPPQAPDNRRDGADHHGADHHGADHHGAGGAAIDLVSEALAAAASGRTAMPEERDAPVTETRNDARGSSLYAPRREERSGSVVGAFSPEGAPSLDAARSPEGAVPSEAAPSEAAAPSAVAGQGPAGGAPAPLKPLLGPPTSEEGFLSRAARVLWGEEIHRGLRKRIEVRLVTVGFYAVIAFGAMLLMAFILNVDSLRNDGRARQLPAEDPAPSTALDGVPNIEIVGQGLGQGGLGQGMGNGGAPLVRNEEAKRAPGEAKVAGEDASRGVQVHVGSRPIRKDGYHIQIQAMLTSKDADLIIEHLKGLGYDAFWKQPRRNEPDIFTLLLGPFTKVQAEEALPVFKALIKQKPVPKPRNLNFERAYIRPPL